MPASFAAFLARSFDFADTPRTVHCESLAGGDCTAGFFRVDTFLLRGLPSDLDSSISQSADNDFLSFIGFCPTEL